MYKILVLGLNRGILFVFFIRGRYSKYIYKFINSYNKKYNVRSIEIVI